MANRKKVSPYYLELFFCCLVEGYDDQLPQYEGLNLVNRASVRRLVRGYLKPNYSTLSHSLRFRTKESLRYGLNFWPEEVLRNCWPETDCLIAIPGNMTAQALYRWIWAELFDGEDCTVGDAQAYGEIPADSFISR